VRSGDPTPLRADARPADRSRSVARERIADELDYEIEALRKNGLAKGGSLDNAIVVGPAGIYNPGAALRFPDEFVRHKILDLMGDLVLLGMPIRARIVAKRCGHGHNIKFLRQLIQEKKLPLNA
jgi:UDP-3-O-[3-hydroxymyristoyl] N-acetylglucosamine deacetylase